MKTWVNDARKTVTATATTGVRGGPARLGQPCKPILEPSKAPTAWVQSSMVANPGTEMDAAAAAANKMAADIAGGVDALVPCDMAALADEFGFAPPPEYSSVSPPPRCPSPGSDPAPESPEYSSVSPPPRCPSPGSDPAPESPRSAVAMSPNDVP